ncbi:MAG: hypothetical protein AAGH92_01535 [Planctomycetota bacterium]
MSDPSPTSQPLPGSPSADGFDVVRELQRLETLRDPIVEVSGRSNRQAARYPVREEAVLYPMSRLSLDDAGQTVFLRDVGRLGVGFLSDRRIEAGQDFRIVFHRGGYAVGESAVGIRYCRPVRTDLFLVGATFVANAGLLTTLGVDPVDLETEYRGEIKGTNTGQSAA